MFRREFFTKCLGVLAGLVGVKAAGATYSGGLVTKTKDTPKLTLAQVFDSDKRSFIFNGIEVPITTVYNLTQTPIYHTNGAILGWYYGITFFAKEKEGK